MNKKSARGSGIRVCVYFDLLSNYPYPIWQLLFISQTDIHYVQVAAVHSFQFSGVYCSSRIPDARRQGPTQDMLIKQQNIVWAIINHEKHYVSICLLHQLTKSHLHHHIHMYVHSIIERSSLGWLVTWSGTLGH